MRWQRVILLIFIALSLSCARVVMPPGGPDDKTSPEVQGNTPENFSTQFYSDKVVIDFDEYIILKDFSQEFVSSPLFNEKPEKILKGKSLVLKFDKDSLSPNTTYTLDFGNSIVDFRAGNVLSQYQYVFSTGDVIDSLHISGYIYWAEDLLPQEQVWVLLYKNFNDSILKTQRPDFIAKTDIDGYFSINNIAEGTYGIAALKDINNNYMFDLPNEQIAFLDSTFVLSIEEENCGNELHYTDSVELQTDSLHNEIDSLMHLLDSALLPKDTIHHHVEDSSEIHPSDSADVHKHYHVHPEQIDLFLFEEAFSNQYLSEYKRQSDYLLSLVFSERQDSVININIKDGQEGQWIVEPSVNKDTFNIWLIDTALANSDSLKLFLEYYRTDTTQTLVFGKDTLAFNRKAKIVKTKKKSRKKKDEEPDTLIVKKKYLDISANFIKQNPFDFFKTPSIVSSFPLDSVDVSKIEFYQKIDTTFTLVDVQISKDSLRPRQYNIEQVLEENTEYKVYISPDAFVDYRTFGNDTIEQIFRTTKSDKYTEILLEVRGVDDRQVIIQLLNTADKLIEECVLTTDSNLIFTYLKVEKYKLKMIDDSSRNGKWDTGDYELKLQPETIMFYEEEIPTKANWSHELVWDLKEE